jgi:hypothetical protein
MGAFEISIVLLYPAIAINKIKSGICFLLIVPALQIVTRWWNI